MCYENNPVASIVPPLLFDREHPPFDDFETIIDLYIDVMFFGYVGQKTRYTLILICVCTSVRSVLVEN